MFKKMRAGAIKGTFLPSYYQNMHIGEFFKLVKIRNAKQLCDVRKK